MATKIILHRTLEGAPDDPAEAAYRRSFLERSRAERPSPRWNARSPMNAFLSPPGARTFFATHFGRTYCHLRSGDRTRLESLFSLGALARLLARRNIPLEHVKVFDRRTRLIAPEVYAARNFGRRATSADGFVPGTSATIDPAIVHRIVSGGGSLSIRHLSLFDEHVGRFAAMIAEWLDVTSSINAYYTPRRGKTLPWHWDGHDFFVFQIEGKKRWSIYEPPFADPLDDRSSQLWHEIAYPRRRKLQSLVLEPGDILYVPAGFPHDVDAVPDADSLHLTAELGTYRWFDVISCLVKDVLHDCKRDPRYRAPLAARGAHSLRSSERVRFRRLVADLGSRLRQTSLDELCDRLSLDSDLPSAAEHEALWRTSLSRQPLVDATQLRRTRATMVTRAFDGDVEVRVGDLVLICARRARRALAFLARADGFRVGDLPGLRTLEDRRELAHALIEAGALTMNG
jgi:hypothetical protein